MKKILYPALFLMLAWTQATGPDLTKKDDLSNLGTGKLIERDKTIYKKIKLVEIKELSITYEKNGSLHDFENERIRQIEFPESKWGYVVIVFTDNKPRAEIKPVEEWK